MIWLAHKNLLSLYRSPLQSDSSVQHPANSTGTTDSGSTRNSLIPNDDITKAKISDGKKSSR